MLGIVLWVAVLKSGVHATLAGVLIAFCVPMRDADNQSPLRDLEHNLRAAGVTERVEVRATDVGEALANPSTWPGRIRRTGLIRTSANRQV